jgi:Ran GTPase-activating protein (RanGAP) involved in mRNA processing and transport
LTIRRIANLQEGAALGSSLSRVLQSTALERLDCSRSALRVDGVRVFQPALRNNQTLKRFILSGCDIRDEGIHLIADALVGNTTIKILNIMDNHISSSGLDDITRILESTRIQKVDFGYNTGMFLDETSTRRFARVLSRHQFLKDLNFWGCQLGDGGIHIITYALD